MDAEKIHEIVEQQNQFFYSGATLAPIYRIEYLRKFERFIRKQENVILSALQEDLGKSSFEGYMCEIGMVLEEIRYMIHFSYGLSRRRRAPTPLHEFPSFSFIQPEPYGTVLIMSPWNYPFLLTMCPLIDAIAAGNTAVVKPSAYSPATSACICNLIEECFPPDYVCVVTGGRDENTALLNEKFDYIFFTGSQSVGKLVMEKAAQFLTPVTLELGGKCPCIVDETANLKLAARRIVFGKFLNCGQTCVAPDYIWVHESVKDPLLNLIKAEIRKQFGEFPLENPNYGKIINRKHFDRLRSLIDMNKTVYGGTYNESSLQIAPIVMDGVVWDDAVMRQEIFGPILPVLTYCDHENVIHYLQRQPAPLALYCFTKDETAANDFIRRISFGGGCINDTVIHLATTAMGFGGVGESGMGSYHGKKGFDTFSHMKSIVQKKLWLDLPMRYQPYRRYYEKLIRIFLR